MNTESNKYSDAESEASETNESKLIRLDESVAPGTGASNGKDINHKITALDEDLVLLREELSAINNSVEEGLDRLSDNDVDLRAKVSETYKRLGEIDNAYKALLEISSRIDGDIRRLNGDVSTVAEQSANGIKSLEISNLEKSHELAQKNQQVASRVNELVSASKHTRELMDEKIRSTSESVRHVEQSLVAEINRLAEQSNRKDEEIERTVEQSQAKILKLQSVDEAILRRATSLEITTAELSASSQSLEGSLSTLESSVEHLNAELKVLEHRHTELEQQVQEHGGLITGLRASTDELADKLAALAGIERRHFNWMSFGFLLLLLATAVIYFSQQNQFSMNEEQFAVRSDVVDNQIANLQQTQVSEKAITDESIRALNEKIAQVDTAVREDLSQKIASIDETLLQMDDQLESVEGRFNQQSGFSEIGDDNIIHGMHWVQQQPADNFLVELAVVKSKDDLYDVAMRYNHRANDTLSYLEVDTTAGKQYVLLMGRYENPNDALNAIRELPGYVASHRPVIRQYKDVQAYLAQSAQKVQ